MWLQMFAFSVGPWHSPKMKKHWRMCEMKVQVFEEQWVAY